MVESLDLYRNCYTVSYCCDLLNEKLNYKIQNRQVKNLLIDYYGENICFTIPEIERNHKCFFNKYMSSRCCRVFEFSNTDIISCAKILHKTI